MDKPIRKRHPAGGGFPKGMQAVARPFPYQVAWFTLLETRRKTWFLSDRTQPQTQPQRTFSNIIIWLDTYIHTSTLHTSALHTSTKKLCKLYCLL